MSVIAKINLISCSLVVIGIVSALILKDLTAPAFIFFMAFVAWRMKYEFDCEEDI